MKDRVWITGPESKLDLIYSDVWLPGIYSRRVLVFELPPTSGHEQAIEILKRGVKALVAGTPELGGLCVAIPSDDYNGKMPWRAIRPYKGVELLVKDLITGGFPSFTELHSQGFPVAAFKDNLLMPISSHINPDPQPVAKFQVSLIEGGLLLSTCIHHRFTDGNGINTIMRTLSSACKQAAENTDDVTPVVLNTDRSVLLALPRPRTDVAHHPAYRIIPHAYEPEFHSSTKISPAQGPTSTSSDSKATPQASLSSDFVPSSFYLSPESALRLKKDASTPGQSWISTHDAITALLWQTTIRARHSLGLLKSNDTTSYGFPRDSRQLIGLSQDWIGNCVYFCAVEASVSTFLAEDKTETLRILAAKIRETISGVDRQCVEEIMALRRTDPYSLTWWQSANSKDPRVFSATSFYHSDLVHADWGTAVGPVRHFTTTDLGFIADGFQRVSYIGPKTGNSGSCHVMAGVDPQELKFLKTDGLWNSYFEASSKTDA